MTTVALILKPAVFINNRLSDRWRIIFNLFGVVSVLAIALLLVLCLYQITDEASVSYSIRKSENRMQELLKNNKVLEISSLEKDSLNSVLSSIDQLNFEKIERVQYIKVINNQVVQNK